MKLRITENEKNRILTLHDNWKLNGPIIQEALDEAEQKAVKWCATEVITSHLGNLRHVPGNCILYATDLKDMDKMNACLTSATERVEDGRWDESHIEKLLDIVVSRSINMIDCVKGKGINVTDMIVDELPDNIMG